MVATMPSKAGTKTEDITETKAYGVAQISENLTINDFAKHIAEHGTLYSHFVAHLQQTEIRAVKRLLHGGDGIGPVLYGDNRQAHAIMGDTLIDLQLVDKRAFQRKVNILAVFLYRYNSSKLLNDS